MGFRISFERVPKGFRLRNSFKDGSDYERYYDEYEKVRECVKYDTCTDIFHDVSNENNRLFTQIDGNEDTVLGTVSKEQLYQWIVEIKNRFIAYLETMLGDDEESLIRMKDYINTKNRRWHYSWKGVPLSMELDFKEDTDIDKMLVSGSSTYEYEIFNFISIYKNFDFERYELVMYGG
ncbi:hypothetical protein [Prevotella corporis]|uniref:hypothetical protein n=1 Tax=Prevotella corporis TaxID=28128 RepID=UPI0023F6EBBC|nr:hypothetical protein [Prevotella corporis]